MLAVHFYAFWYSVSLVTGRLPYSVGAPVATTISGIYLFLVLRRLFGETRLKTWPKALALYAVMIGLEAALALAAGTWVARG